MEFNLSPTQWWFLAAMLLAIAEVVSPFFGFILVSVAALFSAVCAHFNLSFEVQFSVFGFSTALFTWLLRPRIVKILYSSPGIPDRQNELVGLEGVVTELIDESMGSGRIHVSNEDWAAKSHSKILIGVRVVVEGIDGITLRVKALE